MTKNGAGLVYAFPIVLTIGIVLIPVVADYGNHGMAAEAVSNSFRWVAGHLTAAAAFGLGALASAVVLAELRGRSYNLPIILDLILAVGAGLYAAGLGVDGIGPLIMIAAGAPAQEFFDASGWWVSGIFMTATGLFGMGLISLAIHVIRSGWISGPWRYVIFGSALVFVVAPLIPSGWALYGVALAASGVFIPIARRMTNS